MQLDQKVAFNIGWDYYANKITLPPYLLTEEFKSLIDGYSEAKRRKIQQKENIDRFLKKWLLLRVRAWQKNRYFDEEITPEFIKSIDEKRCAITGVQLTHGTKDYSDWSVDRVNNNSAYAVGNIVIVSARANIAKSNYSFEQILNFAYNDNVRIPENCDYKDDIKPLTRQEWKRWVTVCSHAIFNYDNPIEREYIGMVLPCVTIPPNGLIKKSSSNLQMLISAKVSGYKHQPFNEFLLSIEKSKRKSLNKILKNASSLQFKDPIEIWFHEKIFNQYSEFFVSLTKEERCSVDKITLKHFSTGKFAVAKTDNMHLETNGFVV